MPDVFEDSEPEVCSCSALRQATRHVSRLYDEALQPVGLSLNQHSILAKLERGGPMPIQDLAALLVMDRSTVGHLLRPLRKRDLIELDTPPADRRSRIVRPTRTGSLLLQQARPLWAEAERQFDEAFGPENASDLRATLRRVTSTEITDDLPAAPPQET